MEIKNKTLEAYREQTTRHLKASAEFTRKVDQAAEEYNVVKAKYEALIRESVRTGKDKTAELDKLSEQIDLAEKAYERRSQERAAFNSLPKDDQVTKDAVMTAFNHEVTPEFKAKRFDAVLDRLIKAKREYAEAVVDYNAAVKEFDELRDDVLDEIGDDYRYKLAQVKIQSSDVRERYFLTNRDMYDLQNGDMPASVKGAN